MSAFNRSVIWFRRAAPLLIAFTISGSALAAGASDQKTGRLWKSKCASCHGADGKGDTDQGKKMKVSNMATAAYQKSKTDDQLKKAILEGVKQEKDGVKQEMDPYKGELTPEQVDALVKYIRALPTS
jgi:mono/diheme cytochrome c family protein